jgi:hypothetical protein
MLTVLSTCPPHGVSLPSYNVIIVKLITSLQKGKIMVIEDAKDTEAMATLGGGGAHDSHMLDHPWGSIRMKQVQVCL